MMKGVGPSPHKRDELTEAAAGRDEHRPPPPPLLGWILWSDLCLSDKVTEGSDAAGDDLEADD